MQMLGLIQNEQMKIGKRPGTWVMVGLLLLSLLIMALVMTFMGPSEQADDWHTQLKLENEQFRDALAGDSVMMSGVHYVEQRLAINEYRIENDVPPLSSDTVWGSMVDATNLTAVVSLFTIVIAAGIVASEFQAGTIKLLLIRPVSRAKLLLAKYVATMLFALSLLALLFVSSFIIGLLFFGYSDWHTPFLAYRGGEVVEQNMIIYILSLYGLRSIDLIMMVTLAFMISTVFRSSSLAIGLALFLMFVGPQVTQLLATFDWAKFILFANTDLSQYLNGTPLIEGMTLPFSMMMLAVYFVTFVGATWIIFQKRDVAV